MDDAFFQELDAHISNIGSDQVWKKKVGEMEIWFSPISYVAQGKTNEVLADENLGALTVQETKRTALANSIVGFDSYDLRKYRYAGAVFTIAGKDGKPIRVDLSKYIFQKIAGWDSEFVDTTFDVFADLMEGYKKILRKDIKFENVKEPAEELAELEIKVAELREQMGLPVGREDSEEKSSISEENPSEEPPDVGDVRPRRAAKREPSGEPRPKVAFDPFERVEESPEATGGQPPADISPAAGSIPEPVQNIPIPQPPATQLTPIQRELLSRTGSKIPKQFSILDPEVGKTPTNTPDTAHQATPSVDIGVVEHPADRKPVPPPRIDVPVTRQGRNPRFQGPPGR